MQFSKPDHLIHFKYRIISAMYDGALKVTNDWAAILHVRLHHDDKVTFVGAGNYQSKGQIHSMSESHQPLSLLDL